MVNRRTLIDNLPKYQDGIEFIRNAHGDQLRTFSLAPYYTHPIRVACLVMKYKNSHAIDDLVFAALGHDLIEDTQTSYESISSHLGDKALELINELTSDSILQKELGKTAYLCNKLEHMTSWALVIKLCDRLDNVSDFLYAPTPFVKKYSLETREILLHLYKHYDLSGTHYTIMRDIERMISVFE